jgi:hypothetical protein
MRARVSLGGVRGSPSLASIAWWSPCRHVLWGIARPVDSSTITMRRSMITY